MYEKYYLQHKTKTREGLESKYITRICQQLQFYENQKKLYFIRNNSGAIPIPYQTKDGQHKQRLVRFGKSGSADIIIFLSGRVIFLEVKIGKNNLTDNQREFKQKIESLGYEYVVFRENDDVDEILKGEQ